MANTCYNSITFSGDPEKVEALLSYLNNAIELSWQREEAKRGLYQFIRYKDTVLSEPWLAGQNFNFQSLSFPPIDAMVALAAQFHFNFEYRYHEPSRGVYGESVYQNGEHQDARLDAKDYRAVYYAAENDVFFYQGKCYSDPYIVFDILLENKKNGIPNEPYQPLKIVMNPLDKRLAGILPQIDLAGTAFTIDLRLNELRETLSPWNVIYLDDLLMSEDGNKYLFLFDKELHKQFELTPQVTELPDNIVMLEIPYDVDLDPVGVANRLENDVNSFLKDFPLKEGLTARVIPIHETNVPEMLEQNWRDAQQGYGAGR
ncbi:hypothetical protein ABDD95_12470 [Mucilaginibacter sp. PAMB04274]|uniref:DUF1281 family ferredoxin-like fold protein n=1 Tax=Mucilaginibacter sp. PAMB04274 TaxID=3138568 RepID=UPI0031F635D7